VSELVYAGASASFWRIAAVAKRHAYVLKRSPHRLFDVVMWPVVDTLLFGTIGVFASSHAGGAAQVPLYLLVGIVLWHVVYQAQIALATGFLEETWSRNVLNLFTTPIREWEYIAGVVVFGIVKLIIGVGAVVLVAWSVYAFHITELGFGLIPIAVLLMVIGMAIALFVIGLVLRFGSGAEAFAWGILFAVMPVSGVFYPVSALPTGIRPIAQALPTTHTFEVGQALAQGQPLPWGQLGIAVGSTAALLAVSCLYAGWMLRLFRERGYVTRYS
jgi:ABC-2 type transport system permease protein